MWTCPKCQAKVDATFEVCWRCGTTAQGVEDPTFVTADEADPIVDPPVTEEELAVLPVVEETTAEVPFGPDVDLVEAYTAEDRMQAHYLAGELTALGIPAVADLHEPNESFGGMLSLPRIRVRAEDLTAARAWLESFEAAQRDKHPAADD